VTSVVDGVADIVVGGNGAVGLNKTIVGDMASAIGRVARGETGGKSSEISLSVDEIDPSLDCSPLMQENER
jgi:hypothetical protein